MRRLARAILLGLALVSCLGVVPAAADPLDYTVSFSGVGDGLADKVKAQSELAQLKDKGAPNLAALRLRADGDKGRIDEVLRAEGYYEARIRVSVNGGRRPARVAVHVVPGPAFTLAAWDVTLTGQPPPKPVPVGRLGIKLGQRARSAAVIKAQATLLHALADQGYPLAKVANRTVVVDHLTRTMRVHLDVAAGRLAHFGVVMVKGLKKVSRRWVLNRIPWQPGERFSVARMETFRQRLADSRLFSSVRLATAQQVGPDGRLPITATVTEGKAHSVGVGTSWSSTEGFGGNVYWEDRNLLGGAERLRLQATASQIASGVNLSYTGPDFLRRDQDLIGAARAEVDTTNAFFSRTIGASLGLSWLLTDTWRPSLSVAVEHSLEEERNVGEYPTGRVFSLVSLPMELRHDSSDSLLDPTKGDRLTLSLQPFFHMTGSAANFTRVEAYDARYLKVLDSPRVVLAGWARAGSIQGASLVDVPASHRFYVGGAGSVRGFGYQMAGPLDLEGQPVGGLSQLAFGAELRIRATDKIGVVPFAEGGRAYVQRVPDLGLPLFWGAGIGLRYVTAIGPLRADIAFPLDPRPGVDSGYQIYLSLGQAF